MPLRITNGLRNLCNEILTEAKVKGNTLMCEIFDANIDEDDVEIEINEAIKEIKLDIAFAETNENRIDESILNKVLNRLILICPECGELGEEVRYKAEQYAYGRATAKITGMNQGETDDWETIEITYQCTNCESEISRTGEEYFIPKNSSDKLTELVQLIINRTDGNENQINIDAPFIRQNVRIFPFPEGFEQAIQERQENKEFPEGRQLQADISAHGPAGPMMIPRNNGTIASYPEEFLWRPGATWICRHCDTQNEGESQKCRNQECKKGKFAPIVNKSIK